MNEDEGDPVQDATLLPVSSGSTGDQVVAPKSAHSLTKPQNAGNGIRVMPEEAFLLFAQEAYRDRQRGDILTSASFTLLRDELDRSRSHCERLETANRELAHDRNVATQECAGLKERVITLQENQPLRTLLIAVGGVILGGALSVTDQAGIALGIVAAIAGAALLLGGAFGARRRS